MSCRDGPVGQAARWIARAIFVDDALAAVLGLARGEDGGIGPRSFLAENALGLDVADALGALDPIGGIPMRAAAETVICLFTVAVLDLERSGFVWRMEGANSPMRFASPL